MKAGSEQAKGYSVKIFILLPLPYGTALIATATVWADNTLYLNIGLEENVLNRSLLIYPNPATDEVKISFEASKSESISIRGPESFR